MALQSMTELLDNGQLGLVARHMHICFQVRKQHTHSDEPQLSSLPQTLKIQMRNDNQLGMADALLSTRWSYRYKKNTETSCGHAAGNVAGRNCSA